MKWYGGGVMLQAKMKDGRKITPASYSRKRLIQLKLTKQEFFCPVCKEKVILRIGDKVTPHFAHTADTSCPTMIGGEGPYHEQGKLLLYQWLSSQWLKVELEAYLPEINQRPDLLIHLNSRKIAIEYQCSKIRSEEMISRTEGYKQAGIQVIWIIGAKQMKRYSSHFLRLDTFTQTLIHQFTSNYPRSLYYFCPSTFTFTKFQDFTFLSNTLAAGKLTVRSLEKITLKDIFTAEVFSEASLIKVWKNEKRRFRTKPREKLYGKELEWHRWLYSKRLHLEKLPSFIHLPVQGEHLLNIPSWIWQSKIVFDLIDRVQTGSEFPISKCLRLLRNDIDTPEHFPLIQSDDNPIMEYLLLLTHIGILKQTSVYTFKKIKPIELFQDVESAIQADEQLVERLFSKNQSKSEHEGRVFRYTK